MRAAGIGRTAHADAYSQMHAPDACQHAPTTCDAALPAGNRLRNTYQGRGGRGQRKGKGKRRNEGGKRRGEGGRSRWIRGRTARSRAGGAVCPVCPVCPVCHAWQVWPVCPFCLSVLSDLSVLSVMSVVSVLSLLSVVSGLPFHSSAPWLHAPDKHTREPARVTTVARARRRWDGR
jgi:hypothetical protein